MITSTDILEKLAIFQPQQKEGSIEVNLPLLLDSTGECITLDICPAPEGFIISDGGYTFEKYNDPAQKYVRDSIRHPYYFCGHKSVFAVLNSHRRTNGTPSVVCLAKT